MRLFTLLGSLLLVAVSALLTSSSCTPSTIDTLTQDPSQVARWLQAGERIYRATGISWSPAQGECTGPGCAYAVPKFDKSKNQPVGTYKAGDGDPTKFRARVLDGMSEDMDGQVKVHELLHTLLVMHVTSDSVMNPLVSRDCISEAELWQLCHVLHGRCTRQVPECEIEPGWKVIVPGTDGELQIDPVLWEERIKAGKTFVEMFLEVTSSTED